MKLLLERIFTCKTYTIGKLYINGEYFCDTLEDSDRGLTQNMTLSEVNKIKIHSKTAIPIGEYEIIMSIKSPKFSDFKKYKWAKLWDGFLPRLEDVIGFDGVLIHAGNTDLDTSGCILVGENNQKGKVLNSTSTLNKLFPILKQADDKITITIISNYK